MSRQPCFSCSRKTTLIHESVGSLCCECRKHPLDLISKTDAKQEYKVTDAELAALPQVQRPNPKYKCAAPMRLFARRQVELLAASPVVQARIANHERQRSLDAAKDREAARNARLHKRYPSWRDALLPACEAMFNLNRYAKHRECRSKDEIYALKTGLVELLYLQGACIECLAHKRTLPAKECHRCDGSGLWSDSEQCRNCDGSGIFLEGIEILDVAFKFMICGRVFAWHQPDHRIRFDYEASAVEQGVPTQEKPIEMSTAKMREGKHVVRYVLDNAPRLCEVAA